MAKILILGKLIDMLNKSFDFANLHVFQKICPSPPILLHGYIHHICDISQLCTWWLGGWSFLEFRLVVVLVVGEKNVWQQVEGVKKH